MREPPLALDPDEAVAARILAAKFCDDPNVRTDPPQAAVHAPAKSVDADDAIARRILAARFGDAA